jgi:hypothetical protein
MRVEARQHAVDRFLEELLVLDRLDVVALDAAEHLAEEAQVVDRELQGGDLAIRDRRRSGGWPRRRALQPIPTRPNC